MINKKEIEDNLRNLCQPSVRERLGDEQWKMKIIKWALAAADALKQ